MQEHAGDLAFGGVGPAPVRGTIRRRELRAGGASEAHMDIPQGSGPGALGLDIPLHQDDPGSRALARQDQVLQLDRADIALRANFEHDNGFARVRKHIAAGGELRPGLANDLGVFRNRYRVLDDVRAGIHEDDLAAISVFREGILHRRRVVRRAIASGAFVLQVDEVRGRLICVLVPLPLKIRGHLESRHRGSQEGSLAGVVHGSIRPRSRVVLVRRAHDILFIPKSACRSSRGSKARETLTLL